MVWRYDIHIFLLDFAAYLTELMLMVMLILILMIGVVGLMRALKNDTKTLGIATSLVAPAITLTPIISSTEHRQGVDPAEWADRMAKIGVPISRPESVALAVGYLVDRGMEANGQGLLVQKDRVVDFERGLAKSREGWMGREMLDLFRGGREAPLFENKL